jgi:hypothetical protein
MHTVMVALLTSDGDGSGWPSVSPRQPVGVVLDVVVRVILAVHTMVHRQYALPKDVTRCRAAEATARGEGF